MKILVTEMPKTPRECLFALYDVECDLHECILPCGWGSVVECEDTSKCPYRKVMKEN